MTLMAIFFQAGGIGRNLEAKTFLRAGKICALGVTCKSLSPALLNIETLSATEFSFRTMGKRNVYEDDVDFAVLALQSPAFNK